MIQEKYLAENIANGTYWLNEIWFVLWLPLISIGVYIIIRHFKKIEYEWTFFIYIFVTNTAICLYHCKGGWDRVIRKWISTLAVPEEELILTRNWFGSILNDFYIVLFIALILVLYFVEKSSIKS